MIDENLSIERMAALSAPSRVAILKRLAGWGETGVASTELASMMEATQSTVSSQLQVLANAKLVRVRREGRKMIYTANYDGVRELMEFLGKQCACGKVKVSLGTHVA